jgi:diadenosine tetraphosphate (Ap4A) HIT family hydrolase
MTHCKTCQLLAARDSGTAPPWDNIERTQFWDVVHSYNTSLPGWLVLVARRHIEAMDELTEEEAVALGQLIRRASIALKQVVDCQKTYVIQFAEHPDHPHVHFHIVPRMANMPIERRSINIFSHLGVTEAERVSEDAMNAIALNIRAALRS